MTRCWPIPKPPPCFLMEDLALFLLPASLPVTERRSLRAAFSPFRQISGAGGFMCQCADVISTTTGHCAATRAASWSFGSIRPPYNTLGPHVEPVEASIGNQDRGRGH